MMSKPTRPDTKTSVITAADITAALAAYTPNNKTGRGLDGAACREAAVLVPIVMHKDYLSIVMTERHKELPVHAGQISLPGGGVDDSDADATAAALRESAEEIGLVTKTAQVLGRLDHYITVTGFRITPIVALIPPQEFIPEPREVETIFELPLSHLLTPNAFVLNRHESDDGNWTYYAVYWNDIRIWGATAGILRNFINVIR